MANNETTQCEAAAIASVDRHGVNRRAHPLSQAFAVFAQKTASYTGHPVAFLIAATTILVWIVSGPVFAFSDTWQLIINTGTTIVTFLMVFLIQNTQNRDGAAIQAKLDELIRVSRGKNDFIGIEHLSEAEVEEFRRRCEDAARGPDDCPADAQTAERHRKTLDAHEKRGKRAAKAIRTKLNNKTAKTNGRAVKLNGSGGRVRADA